MATVTQTKQVSTPTNDAVADRDKNEKAAIPNVNKNIRFEGALVPTPGLVSGLTSEQVQLLNTNTVSAPFAVKTPGTASIEKPVTTSQPFRVEARSDVDDLRIPVNPLSPFMNLQYHMALSMVPEPNIVGIQKQIPNGSIPGRSGTFNELSNSVELEGSVPFASTGDVFQSEFSTFEDVPQSQETGLAPTVIAQVNGKSYYNIEGLVINNTMAPTAQNPFLNAMFGGKLTIVEPHGFKWVEDVRRIANKIGYSGLSTGRILWRLDIFFSGYNQDTGEWIPFIELDARTRKTKQLTYYINITTVEAKVTHTGTMYDMSIVPSGHSAYRPEEVTLDAGAVYTGSQSENQTFGGFLQNLSTTMAKAVEERTENQVKRIYEFKAPPELLAAQFYSGRFEKKQGFLKNDPNGGSVVTTSRNVNVLTLIEDALKDMQITWDNFLKKDDPRHLEPIVHWGVRFNVLLDSGPNEGTNDYQVITNQYIIEPFASYKHARMNNRTELAKVVDAKSQAIRVTNMVKLGMINRIYNYINTSENTEVIDVDIKLKNFYYHTLFQPSPNSANVGIDQVEAPAAKVKKNMEDSTTTDEGGTNSTGTGEEVPRNQENTIDSALRRLFGRNTDSPSGVCDTDIFKNPYDIYGGGFGEMPKSTYRGSLGSADQFEREEYQTNLDDNLKNDLIRLEMQVWGDPLWLLTPYGNDSGNILVNEDRTNNAEGTTALVQTQSSRCFFLRMLAPNQPDYMNPNREGASTACSVIGGFYQVVTVSSKFQGGKFTQDLTAVKINHLNYVENFVSVVTNDKVDTDSPMASGTTLRSSKPTRYLNESR